MQRRISLALASIPATELFCLLFPLVHVNCSEFNYPAAFGVHARLPAQKRVEGALNLSLVRSLSRLSRAQQFAFKLLLFPAREAISGNAKTFVYNAARPFVFRL
jgi:hypothetical protein